MTHVRIGRRTRKRGALAKAVAFAQARAARLAAAPPLEPRGGSAGSGAGAIERSALLRAAAALCAEVVAAPPWNGAAPGPLEPASQPALLLVSCEGAFTGGSYELCERARSAFPGAFIVASDVFVDPAQIARARRAGADAVFLVARAVDRASLAALSRDARERGLALGVEAASADEARFAMSLGADRLAVALRDRDTFRPAVEAAEAVAHAARAGASPPPLGLFGWSLSPADAERAGRAGVALAPRLWPL
jgi:hypothetical protein